MKFKAGDRVRVKKDLKLKQAYYMENEYGIRTGAYKYFMASMYEFLGKTLLITLASENYYEVCGGNNMWTDEMFENEVVDLCEIPIFNKGDRVSIPPKPGSHVRPRGMILDELARDDGGLPNVYVVALDCGEVRLVLVDHILPNPND